MDTDNFTAPVLRPCKKCGASDRNTSGNCKPCAKTTSLAWKHKNPEKIKESLIKYVLENSGKVKAQQARWYERNKDRASASNKRWRNANSKARTKYVAAWREANQDRYQASAAAYLVANRQHINFRSAAYRRLNKRKIRARTVIWSKANPERIRAYNHNRRARVANAIGTLSFDLSEKLFALQKGMCPCCRMPLGNDFHMDHIEPLALGGSNTDDNIQLLRKSCNHQKSALDPIDFMQRRGFLL